MRDRLRQTLSTFFLSFLFFPVIIKFSEPLFRQLLLFEEPVIYQSIAREGGGGEREQVQDSGGLRGFQGGTERISVVVNRV